MGLGRVEVGIVEVVWGREGLGRTREDKGGLKGLQHCEDQGRGGQSDGQGLQ